MQPTLFEKTEHKNEINQILLYALGEFQARKKILAERELPLDRLRGAFRRACEKFQADELSDREIAENLKTLGAKIVEVPNYVAKHPFRVTISAELAENAETYYKQKTANDRTKN